MIVKRGKTFQVRVWTIDPSSPNGRRKQTIGTYPTRREAREAEAKAISDHSHARGRSQWTVKQFSERWLTVYHGPKTRRKAPGTLIHHRDALVTFIAHYGERRLSSFSSAEAANYAAEFPWRAKVVAAMFNDAVRDGKVTVNPFAGLSISRGKGRSNIDPLSMEEIEQLASIARDSLGFYGPHFAAFITTAGWTGMRPGELCRLEWGDVLWDGKAILVRESKTDQPRRVPMAPRAQEALESVVRAGDRVFHTGQGKDLKAYSYRYYWSTVRAAFEAGLPRDHWLVRRLRLDPEDHLDMYECRHAFGSFLASRGMSAWEIAEILGNSARICEQVYVHPYKSRVRDRAHEVFTAYEDERSSAVRSHAGRNVAGDAR